MPIEIRITAETAGIAVEEMRRLLGANAIEVQWKTVEQPAEAPDAGHIIPADVREAVDADGVVTKSNHVTTQENSSVVAKPANEPAAPAEKKPRQRKTKDAPAVSSLSTDTGQTDIEDAIAKQSISTGEERVGPEDDAATIAQDAADEAAETEATKTALTLDDVRNALGGYVNLFGLEAAMLDGPVVITKVCGEGKVKVSDVPEDKIAAVIAGVQEMITKNPFARAKVAA